MMSLCSRNDRHIFLLPLFCISISYLSHSDYLVVILKFYTVPMFLHAVTNFVNQKTFSGKHVSTFVTQKYDVISELRQRYAKGPFCVAWLLYIHLWRPLLVLAEQGLQIRDKVIMATCIPKTKPVVALLNVDPNRPVNLRKSGNKLQHLLFQCYYILLVLINDIQKFRKGKVISPGPLKVWK